MAWELVLLHEATAVGYLACIGYLIVIVVRLSRSHDVVAFPSIVNRKKSNQLDI